MPRITIDIDCCSCDCGAQGYIVPQFGLVTETVGTVTPTPQFKRKIRGKIMAAVTMTDSQQVPITPKFKDKKGNPAPVDGVPEWFTDNSDVLALEPAADGLSCVVKAVGALGEGTVTMKADADMGAGVIQLIGTVDFTIVGGQATVVELTPGTPTEQPE